MKVSVIIPCYNAEAYLAQAMGSAMDQSRPPDEIVVVDDGSTDRSLKIARTIARRSDIPVQVVSERSGQAARTRNVGADIATGDALMFLDADDVLAPDTLGALVGALSDADGPKNEHGQATARETGGAIALCPWYRLEKAGAHWVKRPPSCRPRRMDQDALSAWLTGWYHPPCSVLWSRAAFERAGRWDERWNPNDDGDLMMRALAYGVPLVYATKGGGYYRRLPKGETSLSQARSSHAGVEARLFTVRKIASLLEDRGRLDAYRIALRRALLLIAAAAPPSAAGLAAEAEAEAKKYAPSNAAYALHTVRGIRRVGAQRAVASLLEEVGPRAADTLPFSLLHRAYRAARRHIGFPSASAGRRLHPGRSPSASELEITYGLAKAKKLVAGELSRPHSSVTLSGGQASPSDSGPVGLAPFSGPARVERPAVSVIVPTYNRAHTLPRALRSVLAQTFDDFEVLVVDDGSVDDTESVVTSLADSRIRYIRLPENRGVGAARNRGLREARADLAAFLDSDDEWMPQKLSKQVALFADGPPSLGLAYTGVESIFDDGTRRLDRPTAQGDIHRAMLQKNVVHGGGSNVMIRRNVVATVGFFDETFPAIEDYDFWVRITRFFDVACLDEALVRYYDPRTRPGILPACAESTSGMPSSHPELQSPRRKSRDVVSNLSARELFYRKHGPAMRRAGVAHRFVLESARRHLRTTPASVPDARRLAARAFLEAPLSSEVHAMLYYTHLVLGPNTRLRRTCRSALKAVVPRKRR